ncbi:MAG: GIY-YIG nuclease family protein [Candidatus Odinarchaeota archaeon]
MGKSYKNTPKGRSELPSRPGDYILKNRKGKTIYQGETDNIKRRINEHHYDKSKHFSYITVTPKKSKEEAKKIERRHIEVQKPSKFKKVLRRNIR